MKQQVERLNSILSHIKKRFIGKDEIVDLLAISLIARENAFLLGPPGTAKSAIARELCACIEKGQNFEYLLTRFTEPNEIFGPIDIRRLKEGELITNTEGMLPEASLVFLDEIFNANSAILNSLLMALNEKIFRRGKETRNLPVLMFIGASNVLPEDEALNALLDRFLIRIKADYVDPDLLESVLIAGRKLEAGDKTENPGITPSEIRELQNRTRTVNLDPILKNYINVIHHLRSIGLKVSDRRAVKIQNLIAASALISGREEAIISDLWVMKHIWDTEEQIEILAGIVNNIIQDDQSPQMHPQALFNKVPDPESLIKEIEQLEQKWNEGLTLSEQNTVKDKLRYLQTRSSWISNPIHKAHIQTAIEKLWKIILQAS